MQVHCCLPSHPVACHQAVRGNDMARHDLRQAICECGQLTLTLSGDPVHHHACTCTRCQRASGSVMTVTAWFPKSQIVSMTGETMTWQPGGAGTEVYRCKRCGGGGYFLTGDYLPDCIGINVGHLADPHFGVPDHVHWWPDRPRWLGTPDGVELLDGN